MAEPLVEPVQFLRFINNCAQLNDCQKDDQGSSILLLSSSLHCATIDKTLFFDV
jgi:hypothetical protein